MNNLNIIIAGGTGFIGRALANYFAKKNEIVILTRNTQEANNAYGDTAFNKDAIPSIKLVYWDAKTVGDWCNEIDGSDVVINLAGKSVNCRYTNANKQAIFDSRTNATKAIALAISQSVNPPKVWFNAASATIYRHATDVPQDERTGEILNDFSVQVCKRWEQTFFEQSTPNTRKIALRMAITLGNGGVMIPYFNLLKYGLSGRQGSGKQMYSWVHIADVYRAIKFLYQHTEAIGVYNISSPNPVTNNVFMATLRKASSHQFGLPAFTWMLKMGAAIIGTETELILKSRWVVPTKLQQLGFTFKYVHLQEAFENIISNTPRKQYHLF